MRPDNATSYGVFVEVNVVGKIYLTKVDIYSSAAEPYPVQTHKIEEPGTFFHPLLATLITGADRLMLAITEHVVTKEGLDWSFCDTDSMAIAKPESMLADLFEQKIKGIVNWFTGLNPYAIPGSILKIEVQNYSAADGKALIPLYCWAVSAKRYALFNVETDGRPIIRKASPHGLGHLMAPYDESHPAHGIHMPHVDLPAIGLKLWQHDLWWQVVNAALNGHPDQVDWSYHQALNAPAMSRYAATSPELLRWFKSFNRNRAYADQVKPFGFLTALSAGNMEAGETFVAAKRAGRPKMNKPVKPIAPFTYDPAEAAHHAFDRESGQGVAVDQIKTYKQMLTQYHLQPEAKFLNGQFLDRGMTNRRHIHAMAFIQIGKEANELDRQMYLGSEDDLNPDYGLSLSDIHRFEEHLHYVIKVYHTKTSYWFTTVQLAMLKRTWVSISLALNNCA